MTANPSTTICAPLRRIAHYAAAPVGRAGPAEATALFETVRGLGFDSVLLTPEGAVHDGDHATALSGFRESLRGTVQACEQSGLSVLMNLVPPARTTSDAMLAWHDDVVEY